MSKSSSSSGSLVATCLSAASAAALLAFLAVSLRLPAEMGASLPKTMMALKILQVLSFLVPVLFFLAGRAGNKRVCLGAVLSTVLALGLAAAAFAVLGLFLHAAVPMVWEHYPDLCKQVPHVEVMHKVITEGCNHECLIDLHTINGMAMDAAFSVAQGEVPRLAFPSWHEASPTCVDDESWGELEDFVGRSKGLFTITVGVFIAIAVCYLGAIIFGCVQLLTGNSVSARERAQVEPLLEEARQEEKA